MLLTLATQNCRRLDLLSSRLTPIPHRETPAEGRFAGTIGATSAWTTRSPSRIPYVVRPRPTCRERCSLQLSESSASIDPHLLSKTPQAWLTWGCQGEGYRRQDWLSSTDGFGFPHTELWSLRGPRRERGQERRLAKKAFGFRSQRQKERGCVEDSQRGRWGSKANDISGTGSQVPHSPAENVLPHREQTSTQGPLSQPPDPCRTPGVAGSWENPGERNVPAEHFCLHGLLQGSSVPASLARPSLPWVPARPGCCRAPGLGRGTQTEELSSSPHTEVQEKDGGDGSQGRGEERPPSTLKSDSEAISSSSSLVAEEAEMRVCCWLEVAR